MRFNVVLALATKLVPALADVKATEPVVDWAWMLALVLVTAPAIRFPVDLSATAFRPDTAPVVKVPPVTSRLTVPALLVKAPVLRFPEDLSATAAPPETAPVESVPAVTSRSTVPALLVTAPTLVVPTASRVMLPLAVPLVPVKVVPAVNTAVPALTA